MAHDQSQKAKSYGKERKGKSAHQNGKSDSDYKMRLPMSRIQRFRLLDHYTRVHSTDLTGSISINYRTTFWQIG